MDLWKNKVVPKFKLLLGGGPKKAAAEAFLKSFDESKEETNKEFEEKKEELKLKVIGIYEASSTEIKTLIKEPRVSGLKKHSAKVQKFLTELADIDFPGSKAASEATSKCGAALVPGPVGFIFEKVSTFIVTEEKTTTTTTREIEIPLPAKTTTEGPPATTTTTTTEVEAKEVVVVEKVAVAEPVKVEAPVETPVPTPAPASVSVSAPALVEATKETPAKVEAVKPEEPPKTK